MLDFQQKRKVKGLMYSKATLYILGVVVLIVLHSTWSVYKKKAESEDMKNLTLQRVMELRTRDSDLRSKIERLDTEAGVEEEIRSKFSVAKENEAMVVIVADEDSKATTTLPKRGFWNGLKDWFKK